MPGHRLGPSFRGFRTRTYTSVCRFWRCGPRDARRLHCTAGSTDSTDTPSTLPSTPPPCKCGPRDTAETAAVPCGQQRGILAAGRMLWPDPAHAPLRAADAAAAEMRALEPPCGFDLSESHPSRRRGDIRVAAVETSESPPWRHPTRMETSESPPWRCGPRDAVGKPRRVVWKGAGRTPQGLEMFFKTPCRGGRETLNAAIAS